MLISASLKRLLAGGEGEGSVCRCIGFEDVALPGREVFQLAHPQGSVVGGHLRLVLDVVAGHGGETGQGVGDRNGLAERESDPCGGVGPDGDGLPPDFEPYHISRFQPFCAAGNAGACSSHPGDAFQEHQQQGIGTY